MFVDMHTHSKNSPDSVCPVYDMALSQKQKGTSIFAVTDHFDFPTNYDENAKKNIINSVNEASNTKLDGIDILKGVEIARGYMMPDIVSALTKKCDFDVIIGSVHGVDFNQKLLRPSKTDYDIFNDDEIKIILNTYFEYLYKVIEFGCDVVAHISYPARYIKRFNISDYTDKFADAFEMMIKKDIALEINTGYLKKANCDFAPNRELIGLYKEMGGKLFTLGSDAHTKENASLGFNEAKEMLNSLDIHTACYFKNRKVIEYEL